MDDFTIDPDELALFLAISEDLNKNRLDDFGIGSSADSAREEIDWHEDECCNNQYIHKRDRQSQLRPFEQYVDDICTGKRSLWDDDPVTRPVMSKVNCTELDIVFYYNLCVFETPRFEKMLDCLTMLQKKTWGVPALALARTCNHLLQDEKESAVPSERSLLKKILADLTFYSDNFGNRKNVRLTLDEGQPGFIVTFTVNQGPMNAKDVESTASDVKPCGAENSTIRHRDRSDENQSMIARTVKQMEKNGYTVEMAGGNYPVSRCFQCKQISVLWGEQKYIDHTLDYCIDRVGICFRCGDEDRDLDFEKIEDRGEYLKAILDHMSYYDYNVLQMPDGKGPNFKKCPNCGEIQLVEGRREKEKTRGISYDIFIERYCLSCRYQKNDLEFYNDDYSDITGPM